MNIKDIMLTVKYGTITHPIQKKVANDTITTYFDGDTIHIDTKAANGTKYTRVYAKNNENDPISIKETRETTANNGKYNNCIKEYGNEEMLRLQRPYRTTFNQSCIGSMSSTAVEYEYVGDMLTPNVKRVTREITTGIGIESHKEIETYTYTNQTAVNLNNPVANADTYDFRSASRDLYNRNIERSVHEFYDFRTNNVQSQKQTKEIREVAGRQCQVTIENNGRVINGNELTLD